MEGEFIHMDPLTMYRTADRVALAKEERETFSSVIIFSDVGRN